MHGELLHQSLMQPVIVLVPPADGTPTAGRDDVICHEALHPLELLLLLGISHLNGKGFRVRLPHGRVCREQNDTFNFSLQNRKGRIIVVDTTYYA